ncbi:MAG: carbohydrate kinase family protein [Anaerolineae bacterium]|nr:carbohydrate kinase family protein [Anaerolineae bacterium]
MDIVITGSIAFDYLMTFPGRFKEHLIPDKLDRVSLSFLVDHLDKHFGGIAPNIAYTLALLGERPRVLGTAGKDFDEYRAWLETAGVDTSAVIQLDDVYTASFFANTDLDNNQIASFYAGAMARARDYTLAKTLVRMPDLVVISPNDPQAMTTIAGECREHGVRYLFDPSQQVLRLDKDFLCSGISGAYILICNEYEFELISQKTGLDRDAMLDHVAVLVVTLGDQGSVIYTGGDACRVPVAPVARIADPTGVGDAYRGGFLKGVAAGWPWELCGQVGAVCAAYVLEQVGTQNHRYTPAEFVARFRQTFDDKGLLDGLSKG